MKLATAYLILIAVIFTYGYNLKQPDIRNVPEGTEAKKVIKPDPRVERLYTFLNRYNSPLAFYAEDFVKTADEYNLDYRLLPAIAGIESTFETNGNTSDNNAFGYMCKSSPCYFEGHSEAIARVGKTIGRGNAYARYRESGQIIELARPYNFVSPEDWTSKLEYFMKKI